MAWWTITRAVFVRLFFTIHGIVSIWRLYLVTREPASWYIAVALVGLLAESIVTIGKNKGHEWKWSPFVIMALQFNKLVTTLSQSPIKKKDKKFGNYFYCPVTSYLKTSGFCPSVFFYLLCVVPAIWLLELAELDRRILFHNQRNLTDILQISKDVPDDLRAKIHGLNIDFHIPLNISASQWTRTLEQILLLFLIIGRWLLPKGKLTHDQLSQLLLVYIGTAADIVEFFEAFKEEEVQYNRILCHAILAIWSWSLVQFTLVLTASSARNDRSGVLSRYSIYQEKKKKQTCSCCRPDVYGIVVSIIMQDMPYLVLRLLLIFKYGVVSYTNMFFTCKNTLVIMLLLYRLVVVNVEQKQKRIQDETNAYNSYKICDEGSESKLLSPGSGFDKTNYNTQKHSLSHWNDYKSEVYLKDVEIDPSEPPVKFIIKPHIKSTGFRTYGNDCKSVIGFKVKNNVKSIQVKCASCGQSLKSQPDMIDCFSSSSRLCDTSTATKMTSSSTEYLTNETDTGIGMTSNSNSAAPIRENVLKHHWIHNYHSHFDVNNVSVLKQKT